MGIVESILDELLGRGPLLVAQAHQADRELRAARRVAEAALCVGSLQAFLRACDAPAPGPMKQPEPDMSDPQVVYRQTETLVFREVHCSMSLVVDELLKHSLNDGTEAWEEVEALKLEATGRFFRCNDCELEWEKEPSSADEADEECLECSSANITEDEERRQERSYETEIYEWWSVSGWVGDKLRERGEIVYENWGHTLWGRTGTGQAIALDHVWQTIAKELWK